MTNGGEVTLRITDELDIYRLQEFRNRLLEALEEKRPLVLDAGGVESCHVAGLQLLVALQRAAAAAGVTVRLENPSPVLMESMRAVGLEL